ncbi:hypothetical protein AC622_04220 [Bacillus sp. FJAT-27916]|nr:hypothetical protein AC622_04220 [Bacillus sp. FJAT-27916]
MGRVWEKRGTAQRKPTLCPCKGDEGWSKGVKKVVIVRKSPPFTHTKGMKGGQRVLKRWSSSEEAHPLPMQKV